MFNFSAIFKVTKKVDHILESSLDSTSFFDALNVLYQLSEIKDDMHVVSCLLGHNYIMSSSRKKNLQSSIMVSLNQKW